MTEIFTCTIYFITKSRFYFTVALCLCLFGFGMMNNACNAVSNLKLTSQSTLPNCLPSFRREDFEGTCRRRFFFGPSFDIYGGVSGQYDLGPPLCAIKYQVLEKWRDHFLREENMCEIDPSCITPEVVFSTSGHLQRFNDIMARDTVTGECVRLDKFVQEWLMRNSKLDGDCGRISSDEPLVSADIIPNLNKTELGELVAKYDMKSSEGNKLSEPFEFNLMFETHVGPEKTRKAYLRPELAQGICLNFKRLLETNSVSRLPFAACAIGPAFRNEISPRASLLRVREFTLAEIEHFVNPSDKSHEKFATVAEIKIWLLTREEQEASGIPRCLTIGEAVSSRMIDNETVGYYLGRIELFLRRLGVKFTRYRQHLNKEMAHYAQDCWDCELLTSYGWVEVIGIADRSAYDLTAHANKTGKDLTFWETLPEAREELRHMCKPCKPLIGKVFGKKSHQVLLALSNLSLEKMKEVEAMPDDASFSISIAPDDSVTICRNAVTFEHRIEKITGRSYIPSVIEPSFGIGRLLFALLEQSYWVRRDESGKNEQRAVFSLSPGLAPFEVAVIPLMVKDTMMENVRSVLRNMTQCGLRAKTDESAVSVGKKYARLDEIGTPFTVTVDLVGDGKVTLRERDSTEQIRIDMGEVAAVVHSLCRCGTQWETVRSKFYEQ